jgi:predicted transcriptional regulator
MKLPSTFDLSMHYKFTGLNGNSNVPNLTHFKQYKLCELLKIYEIHRNVQIFTALITNVHEISNLNTKLCSES